MITTKYNAFQHCKKFINRFLYSNNIKNHQRNTTMKSKHNKLLRNDFYKRNNNIYVQKILLTFYGSEKNKSGDNMIFL